MNKTFKTVLAIIGAVTALCAILLIIKKKLGCKCCCSNDANCGCGCDKPDTVEDFVEAATETAEKKVEEVKETAEEAQKAAEEKAEAIAEEFKDYADVELPKE